VKTKIWVGAVLLLTLFFLAVMFQRGVLFLFQPEPAAKGIGAAVIVIGLVGAWVVWREVTFGMATQRLANRLSAEGGLPVDDLPRTPAGRVVRAAADENFTIYQEETEASPLDWRSWFRLSLAYDAAGDRRRARGAARQAIVLERSR
jgi:hypothetical protein